MARRVALSKPRSSKSARAAARIRARLRRPRTSRPSSGRRSARSDEGARAPDGALGRPTRPPALASPVLAMRREHRIGEPLRQSEQLSGRLRRPIPSHRPGGVPGNAVRSGAVARSGASKQGASRNEEGRACPPGPPSALQPFPDVPRSFESIPALPRPESPGGRMAGSTTRILRTRDDTLVRNCGTAAGPVGPERAAPTTGRGPRAQSSLVGSSSRSRMPPIVMAAYSPSATRSS